jgi:glyoxylase-like metal-dependent hydrolase (beta-lactamase superfamily II)
MQLGAWQLETVSGGNSRVDGGTMFGVVPKILWERFQPADHLNRIRCATNCVLARDGRHAILIDTGYGGKASDAARQRAEMEPGEPLLKSLAALNVTPEEIDRVVLSHLHFDHAGGGTRRDERGRIGPAFPRARYVVQRGEWETAVSNVPELRGAYPAEHFLPLAESGQLEFIEGDAEIVPGLRAMVTGGHTRWHQALIFESEGQTAIYLGDLCPMTASAPTMWGLAYDAYPLETRIRKPQLLGRAADAGWIVLWCHDPDVAASRVARDPRHEFAVVEPRARL